MANVHAIVGEGSAPERVIEEGLRDVIKDGDFVGLVWNGKPTPTEEVIFDYVLDEEIQFTMYYEEGQNPPKAFRESAHGTVSKVRNASVAAVKDVEGKGKVLYLWDTGADDDQVLPIFDLIDKGTLVLELTNGLAPIVVNDDIPEPTDPEIEKDPDEVEDTTSFTKAELETMTAGAVKRYGTRMGTTAQTKKGIIEELFPEGDDSESSEQESDPEEAQHAVREATAAGSQNVGTVETVTSAEVPQLLRLIAGNLIRLANALTPES